ncbi:MAG: hybrid sensor histidine kinase/response regulator [Anaerolineaceae bacterium]|nr:MAG: hybrid sensor histidine kinase/response regulator [Anaerolineaceae bacterium]
MVIKILVIEDADALRQDIAEMLRFEGFDVRHVGDGAGGVELAKHYLPDLIVCDIMMPRMDGYAVLKTLREEESTTAIPLIFLTAKTDRSDVRFGMGMGADDYLTKPFVASELLDAIRARLGKQRTIDAVMQKKMEALRESIMTALPHELRTPLNTIIGFSDMIVTGAHDVEREQIAEWASHISADAQRLYRLIENYLLYVRAELLARDGRESAKARQNVLSHPTTIIAFQVAHRFSAAGRQDDLHMDLCDDVPVHIVDHDLAKIVDELIDNALKFSEAGHAVKVEAYVERDHLVLAVADKGRGMSAEQIAAIGAYVQFERWLYEQQGSGLGLAICGRLLEIYGGEMDIESEPKAWTRVSVRLRRAAG